MLGDDATSDCRVGRRVVGPLCRVVGRRRAVERAAMTGRVDVHNHQAAVT